MQNIILELENLKRFVFNLKVSSLPSLQIVQHLPLSLWNSIIMDLTRVAFKQHNQWNRPWIQPGLRSKNTINCLDPRSSSVTSVSFFCNFASVSLANIPWISLVCQQSTNCMSKTTTSITKHQHCKVCPPFFQRVAAATWYSLKSKERRLQQISNGLPAARRPLVNFASNLQLHYLILITKSFGFSKKLLNLIAADSQRPSRSASVAQLSYLHH